MDTHPKEKFVDHAAGGGGLSGTGSVSYTYGVAFRDKDTTAWTANGRTPLDQRHYSLLNWRSDVVVVVTDAGALVQHARYNDSGSPWGVPAGDVNGDGIVNTVDTGILLGAIGGAYVARYDLNLDGTVDAADHTIGNNNLGDTLGHNALSLNPSSDVRGGHRLGYTGHTHADFNNALIVMRHRWYSGDLGRFMSRDPMGFVDGANVYAYARGNGVRGRDPMGLECQSATLPFEEEEPVAEAVPFCPCDEWEPKLALSKNQTASHKRKYSRKINSIFHSDVRYTAEAEWNATDSSLSITGYNRIYRKARLPWVDFDWNPLEEWDSSPQSWGHSHWENRRASDNNVSIEFQICCGKGGHIGSAISPNASAESFTEELYLSIEWVQGHVLATPAPYGQAGWQITSTVKHSFGSVTPTITSPTFAGASATYQHQSRFGTSLGPEQYFWVCVCTCPNGFTP